MAGFDRFLDLWLSLCGAHIWLCFPIVPVAAIAGVLGAFDHPTIASAAHGFFYAWIIVASCAIPNFLLNVFVSWSMKPSIGGRRVRYALNSAVITAPGLYRYRLLSPEEALTWWRAGPVEARIGYRDTCTAVARVLGLATAPEVDRRTAKGS